MCLCGIYATFLRGASQRTSKDGKIMLSSALGKAGPRPRTTKVYTDT